MEKVTCSKCGADNTTKSKYCSSCGYELPKFQVEDLNRNIQQNTPSKSDSKKKIIGIEIKIAIGVITFLIVYFGVQQIFFKSATIDKEMMNTANEINMTCPFMVDSETRLDNTLALPDNVFQYNYTLINVEKSKADTVSIKNYLEPNILNLVRTSPQMQYQRDHKWTLNYFYKDKSGLYLLLIRVTPEKYEK
jgi:hypothetical protein